MRLIAGQLNQEQTDRVFIVYMYMLRLSCTHFMYYASRTPNTDPSAFYCFRNK